MGRCRRRLSLGLPATARANGWPQLDLATAIAAGSSGTSVDRWLVIPLQVLLVGPLLLPFFLLGLHALWRSPQRWLAVAYGVLLVQTVVTGGKPYYTLGLVPAILARLENAAGLENEESGRVVAVCRHTGGWTTDWPRLRRLG